MNYGSSANSSKSEIEGIVDRVCREFEQKFHEDPAFRIENLLDDVRHHFNRILSEVDQANAKNQAIAELIFIEMELRCKKGQSFDTAEYFDRFPDFRPAIEESFDLIRRQYPDFRELCSVITVLPTNKADDDGMEFALQLDSPRDFSIPDELGPYRKISRIKSGSFGIVCRATDSRDGRVVALKFPRQDKLPRMPNLNMFFAEAGKAMKLDHPGIVRTFSIETSNGFLAIVQQFIDGSDLKAAREQLKGQKEIALLVANIADALAYAHRQGIYHRDLKPANILVDQQGRPFIVDFGLAINDSEQMYLPSQRCGTSYYMPPEQVAGLTRLIDGRSDIWSLGVVLYELLTKQKPFRGATETDIYYQIDNKDPKPPRQIDDSIDPELQRICLKCLERKQRDRYLTADELADDLRHWAGLPNHKRKIESSAAQFLPKGLRSYSAEDAPFFLDLLPGPRDREGLPDSIRFWKLRICEPLAAENRVPVGIIFGPSGSGKSSFIKAGLLPQLDGDVLTVYVEATQVDTEVRLLKALRQRLDGIPEKISLPELFRGLSHGQWLPAAYRKLLIVIDQFEQRLSLGDEFATSQLAKALRFCDGQQLQSLLLTRDDFMMALSRFVDALEMDLREGENAQAIDLFDKKHASKVLAKLGRAFDRLPVEPAPLSEEHEAFLNEAVNQLAGDDHVICVHLVLFAEMFRHRPWTPTELNLVGGVAGTGEKFLEATFGPAARDQRYRMQRESAERVLESLLPAAGTDIRGAMKPEHELVAAAKLQNRPDRFKELIKSLDGRLKLITRTDPDRPDEADLEKARSSPKQSWYQLTHDYLVPSVRSWLDSTLGKTRAGRAKLRLRDLGAQVVPGQPPRNLPTNLEWLAWQFQIPTGGLSLNERSVVQHAGRRFFRQAAAALAVFLLIGTIFVFARVQNANRDRIAGVQRLIQRLINEEVPSIVDVVQQLAERRAIAEPMLHAIVSDSTQPPRDRLRAAMGLLPYDSSQSNAVVNAATRPDCPPDELIALTNILANCQIDVDEQLTKILVNAESSPRSRFRALCTGIRLRAKNDDLGEYAGLIANALCEEPLETMDQWIAIIQPVGQQFLPTFKDIFSDADAANKSYVMAKAMFECLQSEDQLGTFADLLGTANEFQFDAILTTIEESRAGDAFAKALEKIRPGQLDDMAQTNVAIGLARLGHDANLIQRYSGDFELTSTILAITFSTQRRLRLHSLRQLYEGHSVAASDNVNLRRSTLQALALQSVDVFDPALRNWLIEIARTRAENDPDACCFSTSELILSRLGIDTTHQWRHARRNKPEANNGIYGNILIDAHGGAFSIIQYRDQSGQLAKFAIATTETTNREFDKFKTAVEEKEPIQNPQHPFELQTAYDFRLVYYYCNWLSTENGLSENMCYPSDISMEVLAETAADVLRTGYRLPTIQEWTAANKSLRVLEVNGANSNPFALNYAWVFDNAGGNVREVATRLPNAAGLFDSFGNVQEICQAKDGDLLEFFEIGQSARVKATALSIDKGRWHHEVINPDQNKKGIRLVRTLQ